MRSQMHPSAQDTPSYSLTEPSFSESLCIRIPLFTPSCGLIHAAPFPPTSQAVVCCLLLAHVSPWTLALLPRPPGCAQPPCCLAKGTSSADTEGRPASQPHTSSRSPPSAAAPAPPALPSSLTILGTPSRTCPSPRRPVQAVHWLCTVRCIPLPGWARAPRRDAESPASLAPRLLTQKLLQSGCGRTSRTQDEHTVPALSSSAWTKPLFHRGWGVRVLACFLQSGGFLSVHSFPEKPQGLLGSRPLQPNLLPFTNQSATSLNNRNSPKPLAWDLNSSSHWPLLADPLESVSVSPCVGSTPCL